MEHGLVKHNPQPTNTSNLALTTDEKYFYQLEREYTIKQYEELQLKDEGTNYEGAELARYHIGNALQVVYNLVGLKKDNWPTGDLAKRIARYIQNTFAYISPTELITAVEFGLQGKFPTLNKKGESIFEHYQIMDLTWINDLLQGYVKFRYDKKVSVEKKVEESKLPAREQLIEIMIKDDRAVKELVIQAFEKYKADPEDKVIWIRSEWVYWLCDIGLIKYDSDEMNAKYNELRGKRFDLTPAKCKHLVLVATFYEWCEQTKEVVEPFEKFNTVTYVNRNLLSTLYTTDRKAKA